MPPDRHARRRTPDAGFALLVVLWTLALLAVLAAQFVAAGRQELQLATNLRDSAMLQAAADDILNRTILELLQDGRSATGPDARIVRTASPAVTSVVRVDNLGGRMNPNTASPLLIAAMLRHLGVAPSRAALVAAGIDAARGSAYAVSGGIGRRSTPFASLGELQDVPGFDTDILARLRPHISLYQAGIFDPSALDPVVEQALAELGFRPEDMRIAGTDVPYTVAITVTAAGAGGGRFTRRAVVRFGGAGDAEGRPYHILAWDAPDD